MFVRGVPFTVIGVMVDKQQMGMYGGPDVDKASIPLTTFEAMFGKRPYHNVLYTVKRRLDPERSSSACARCSARRSASIPTDESAVHFWDTVKNREMARRSSTGSRSSWAWSAR